MQCCESMIQLWILYAPESIPKKVANPSQEVKPHKFFHVKTQVGTPSIAHPLHSTPLHRSKHYGQTNPLPSDAPNLGMSVPKCSHRSMLSYSHRLTWPDIISDLFSLTLASKIITYYHSHSLFREIKIVVGTFGGWSHPWVVSCLPPH